MSEQSNKYSTEELYEQRYKDGYMEDWDDLKKMKVRQLISEFSLPPVGKALDFGCGNGIFTNIIKQILPGWEVYGTEISSIAVRNAQSKYPDCKFFGATDSGKYAGQFDFIFSHHVMEHVENLNDAFQVINEYLRPHAFQLHILPCGNAGSFEHDICLLKKNGIETEKENRFFFEEPGHLRRLTTEQFKCYENKLGFSLEKEFYSNQYLGAIDWITKSSPRFVKKLTDPADATDDTASKKLAAIRKKLLPLSYLQFPYSKYLTIRNKWHKDISDYLKLLFTFLPAMVSRPFYRNREKKSLDEWNKRKTDNNGSEMFLFFKR